ncbi:MAG TPA: DUF502 domain-containing protein [Rhizomicrobium sp.]|jgi:uncharacterized membrane protein|nr:DUF502 domain-containing protein [Rhizomicrobium sp.]
MSDAQPRRHFYHANFQGYLIAGLLTITPLIVVWLVFDYFLNTLSFFGHPLAVALTDFVDEHLPQATPLLASVTVRFVISVFVALLALYTVGAIASRVAGQRFIGLFERIIARIPLVETIYSAVKKLIDVMQQKPGGTQRVVLVDFPREGMKAIGFVMKTFRDTRTGEDLAAVYVPTAPNPTSGYLEIVPTARLVPTEMATDQAMTMILSGGAIAPDGLSIVRPE